MSWSEQYRQQYEAWNSIAQRHASLGNDTRAREAQACADVYRRLLDEAEQVEAPSA